MLANKLAIQKWKQNKEDVAKAKKDDTIVQIKRVALLPKPSHASVSKEKEEQELKKYELILWKKEQKRQEKIKEEARIEKQKEERRHKMATKKLQSLDREKRELEKRQNLEKQKEGMVDLKPAVAKSNNNLLVLALQEKRELQVLEKRQNAMKKKVELENDRLKRLSRLQDSVLNIVNFRWE